MGRRLVVAVLVLAFVAAGFVIVKWREDRQARAERREARLLSFDDREVRAAVLTSGGTDWRYEFGPDGWRLVSPVEDAADPSLFPEFLAACRRATVLRVIEDPEPLEAYGLAPPLLSIRIEGPDVPVLDVGEPTPIRDGLFARVRGRDGVLVLDPREGQWLGGLHPAQLRDPTVTGLPRSEVERLGLYRPSGATRLEREGASWWFTKPLRFPASDVHVEAFMTQLDDAHVIDLLDHADREDPALGLGVEAARIELGTSDRSREIVVGAPAPEGGRYALRSDRGTVLVIAGEGVEEIPPDFDALAEKRLTKVNRYRVTDVVYTRGVERFEARREPAGAWKRADGREWSDDDAYAFLASALEAPTAGWSEGTPSAPPDAVLELELEDGGTERIEYLPGGRARVGSVPGVLYRVAGPPPALP